MERVKVSIYFDGACRNIKGSITEPFGVGVATYINGVYSTMYSKVLYGPEGTSNIAEWTGCVEALRIVSEISYRYYVERPEKKVEITVYTDSQLIANQFNELWSIKEDRFKSFYKMAKECVNKFNVGLKLTWVPRTMNQVADVLSKRGLEGNFDTSEPIIKQRKTKQV